MMGVQLEEQVDQWRGYVERRRGITAADVAEMEDHLRSQVTDLVAGGLDEEEAFLVAVKRMGNLDDVSREFAREHSERLWKQLVLVPEADESGAPLWRELAVVLGIAIASGIVVRVLFAAFGDDDASLIPNLPFAVLPFVGGYFAWKRQLDLKVAAVLVAVAAALAVVLNVYPFEYVGHYEPGMTFWLATLHAPFVLWALVGVAHVGGAWRSDARRMDFVRFTGELVMYLALLTIGSGVLLGLTFGVLAVAGVDPEHVIEDWIMPFGLPGVVLVAAWLVEQKMNVVENIAPVLTKVFTPLTLVALVAMLGVMLSAGSLVEVDRELLLLMNGVLLLVVSLVLYSISARDPLAPASFFDRLQLVVVVAALAVDAVALSAMLGRIAEFGWSANKAAALGLNLLLLVHLGRSGWLLLRFARGAGTFAALERWQTRYLPVYAVWAAFVVVAFGPLFGFA